MQTPFLALITPIDSPITPSGGVPTHPIYYPPVISGPPGPWPNPPIFIPPTMPGQPPLGFWGPPGPWVTPPIAFPPGWIGGVNPNPPIVIVQPPLPPDGEFPQVPPPPEVTPSSQLVLAWAQSAWNWAVIPPPAFVKPPPGAIPK